VEKKPEPIVKPQPTAKAQKEKPQAAKADKKAPRTPSEPKISPKIQAAQPAKK